MQFHLDLLKSHMKFFEDSPENTAAKYTKKNNNCKKTSKNFLVFDNTFF